MKHLLITTIAAVLLVGCGESQQSAPPAEAKPKPPTAKAPDISIWSVAADGNIEAVKQAIADGADVNVKDQNGRTPLQLAALRGHKEVAELLIAKGADVSAKSEIHGTPLDLAISGKHPKTADLLRKHGGKTTAWFKAGESIHIAASEGHIEAVKQHIADGADVNAKDSNGMTPLLLAAWKGHKVIAELLIANGADVNIANDGVVSQTALHVSIGANHKEIAELLIANGANVNAKDWYGLTPLNCAIISLPEIADLLRKHGGKTGEELSIHKAAESGNIEAVKQHLAAGADVNAMGGFLQWTLLQYAASGGHKEIVELLIAEGADVNAKGNGEMTPLHIAANKEIVELLIAAGVDVNAKNDDGETPMDMIMKSTSYDGYQDKEAMAQLLHKHGGKTGAELKAEGK
jgi:cytohesin